MQHISRTVSMSTIIDEVSCALLGCWRFKRFAANRFGSVGASTLGTTAGLLTGLQSSFAVLGGLCALIRSTYANRQIRDCNNRCVGKYVSQSVFNYVVKYVQ